MSSPASSAGAAAPGTSSVGSPGSRVPATCEDLATPDELAAFAGAPVIRYTAARPAVPAVYADDRLGSLVCDWSTAPDAEPGTATTVSVEVIPGVTAEQFAAGRPALGAGMEPSPSGGDSYVDCAEFEEPEQPACSLWSLLPGYLLHAHTTLAPAGTALGVEAASGLLFTQLEAHAAVLDEPMPFWEPDPSLAHVTDCAGLIGSEDLAAIIGAVSATEQTVTLGSERSGSGSSPFGGPQVGAYHCSWAVPDAADTDSDTEATGADTTDAGVVTISSLPGGVYQLSGALDHDADPAMVEPYTEVPVTAYRSTRTAGAVSLTRVDLLAADGWVQIEVPSTYEEPLAALSAQVLENLGVEAP